MLACSFSSTSSSSAPSPSNDRICWRRFSGRGSPVNAIETRGPRFMRTVTSTDSLSDENAKSGSTLASRYPPARSDCAYVARAVSRAGRSNREPACNPRCRSTSAALPSGAPSTTAFLTLAGAPALTWKTSRTWCGWSIASTSGRTVAFRKPRSRHSACSIAAISSMRATGGDDEYRSSTIFLNWRAERPRSPRKAIACTVWTGATR